MNKLGVGKVDKITSGLQVRINFKSLNKENIVFFDPKYVTFNCFTNINFF